VTWLLFLLQVSIFIGSFSAGTHTQSLMDSQFSDAVFTKIQGRLFAKYVISAPDDFSKTTVELSHSAILGSDSEKLITLGNLAWRDLNFSKHVDRFLASEDQVMVNWWHGKFLEIQSLRQLHPNHVLGLAENFDDWLGWVSYQFSHSGSVHLISNMIFLLIFGSALERTLGGTTVLIAFLGAGAVAAGSFLLLDQPSAVPLIGASGAVSGLMALFAVLYWRRSVRYLYFLLIPKRGFMGFIYLPGWVILFMWVLTDLAGFFGTPESLGGVAYSAHLGGEMAGVLVALAIIGVRKYLLGVPLPEDPVFLEEKPLFTLVR